MDFEYSVFRMIDPIWLMWHDGGKECLYKYMFVIQDQESGYCYPVYSNDERQTHLEVRTMKDQFVHHVYNL